MTIPHHFTLLTFSLLLPLVHHISLAQPLAPDADAPVHELAAVTVFSGPETASVPPLSSFDLENILGPSVDSLSGLRGFVPGFSLSNADTRGYGNSASMRGIGNTPFFGPPAVAVYVDGVSQGDLYANPLEVYDIQSVEVSRGPRATRFGQNAPAGVIEITTRADTADDATATRGTVQGTLGEYNQVGITAGLQTPLQDEHLTLGLSLNHEQRDGYIENNTLGGEQDERDAWQGRARLHWTPDDIWTFILGLDAARYDDGGPRLLPLRGGPGQDSVGSDVEEETLVNRNAQSFSARYRGEDWIFHSITSRQEWHLDPSITDLDLSPLPGNRSEIRQHQGRWTQEFRIECLPTENHLAWRAGVFLSHKDDESTATRDFLAPNPFFNPGNPLFGPPAFAVQETTDYQIKSETAALFASADIPLGNDLEVQSGLRGEWSAAEIDRSKSGTATAPDTYSLEEDEFFVVPELRLLYDQGGMLSYWAAAAYSAKPGGYSGYADEVSARFDHERSAHYETGVNFVCPEGRARATLTLFWVDADDYQVERSQPGTTNYVVVNVEEMRSRGIEFETTFRPVDFLRFDLAASWLDAEFQNATDSFTGESLDGNRPPFIPEWTVALNGTVLLSRNLYMRSGLRASSGIDYSLSNDDRFASNDHIWVEAALGYRTEDWEASIQIENAFDETYFETINEGIAAGIAGPPRVVSATLGRRF